MADTAKLFTNGLLGFFKGDCKWLTTGGSTFKVALLKDTWTPNQDTDEFWDDISAYEVDASGDYASGGATLVTSDPTVDTASNEIRFDANDVTFTGFTGSAKYYAVYHSTGTAGTSRLICYQTNDPVRTATNGPMEVKFASTGVFKSVAA